MSCSPLQKSLVWCMGSPELPGIRQRVYYISKDLIAEWPRYVRDDNRRTKKAAYSGSFVLVADTKWKYIDILPDKSQLTSEAQGELPSQTQLNKLVAVFPGVSPEASAAACYLNNSDNVFLVEDMRGFYRVVGCQKWVTKTTVTQDNGQGSTGTTSTTINVEAADEVPAPFYSGIIETEDGDIQGEDAGADDEGDGEVRYNNMVTINGTTLDVSGGAVSIQGPLTALGLSGQNMKRIFLNYDNLAVDEVNITTNGTYASWSGSIPATTVVAIFHDVMDNGSIKEELWFTINVL